MIVNEYENWDEEIQEEDLQETNEDTFLSEDDNTPEDDEDEEDDKDSIGIDEEDDENEDDNDDTETSTAGTEEHSFIEKVKDSANTIYKKVRTYEPTFRGFCGRCTFSGCYCKRFVGQGDTCQNCGHAFNMHY